MSNSTFTSSLIDIENICIPEKQINARMLVRGEAGKKRKKERGREGREGPKALSIKKE